MAQKFKNGALVKVKGSLFSVLIVRRYDAAFERYLCSSGTQASSYKTLVKESEMTLCTPDGNKSETKSAANLPPQ